MKKRTRFLFNNSNLAIFLILFLLIIIPACEDIGEMDSNISELNSNSYINDSHSTESNDQPSAENLNLQSNANIVYSPDGKGYLITNEDGKKLLHVEGSGYEMGYQHGYLLAEGVTRMASEEYWAGLIIYFLEDLEFGLELHPDDIVNLLGGEKTVDALVNFLYSICEKSFDQIPIEYIEEMEGIVNGVNDAGYEINYKSVMMNNLAIDVILSIIYPIVTPVIPVADLFMPLPHACNAFVLSDKATKDGNTLMGRDFMFSGIVFHETALLIEYVPDNGNKFISVTTPAFVGVTAAMNNKGIGIGIDMLPAMGCNINNLGMGGLLICREVAQYANELDDAVEILINEELGVPWIFPVGDGIGEEKGAAIVEVSSLNKLVRYSDYIQPESVQQSCFPKIIEDKEDVTVTTNHYLIPEMYTSISWPMKDSMWRYEILTELILESYGNIDADKGIELIDFLHPPNYGYYGDDVNQPVSASISLFDLTNLELWALFGLYSDPWAHYKF